MCGIAGAVHFKENDDLQADVTAMTKAMSHRGPDAEGDFRNKGVWLGHRRLSVIDLSSAANQPMVDNSGRFYVVFNGEIYNYSQLRREMSEYDFRTQSDTEVILAAYRKWGTDCVNHFVGMFAIAIWDQLKRELFIARDRVGVKPLYYYRAGDEFIFASEIRALLASGLVPRKLNYVAVAGFFQFQSVCQPQTLIEGVRMLEAGSYMIIGAHKSRHERYWTIENHKIDFDFSDRAAVQKKVAALISQSVDRRMISDVPVAAFLSGGIDSSIVVALMSRLRSERINTFTIGFEDKAYDESDYAALVSRKFNTRHELISLKPELLLEQLPSALQAMDTPSGDGINSYVVSKVIRERGIKVALSGVGGDELFAGYPIFSQYLRFRKFRSVWGPLLPFRMIAAKFLGNDNTKSERYRQLLRAPKCNIKGFYPALRQILPPAILRQITTLTETTISETGILNEVHAESIENLPQLSQVSIAEYIGYTRNTLLCDMDQTSMAVSLEMREPFFDHELIEFVLSVPDSQKIGKYPKYLMVNALDGLLPMEVITRRKQGFLFPWSVWMRNELRFFCEDHIRRICRRDFIDRDALTNYWQRFQRGDNTVRWLDIWLFVVLEHWLNRNGVE